MPNKEKIFSIFEDHTDIIVKGGREVKFGHMVNLAGGKSNLILDCRILDGTPADAAIYGEVLDRMNYGILPRNVVTMVVTHQQPMPG